MSPNRWISVAIAQRIGVVETASDLLKRRAGNAQPGDMSPFPDNAKREVPPVGTKFSGESVRRRSQS